jgi:DNA polymerase-3 subunit gamma/tau
MTEKYIPLALKYRPKYFSEFIYNEPSVLILKSMLMKKQLPNGLILSGVRGIGKTTLARIFARTLNCLDMQPDGEACGKCDSCQMALDETLLHPNIKEIDGATHGKIEDIRRLLDDASMSTMYGGYKVYIVDEAQGLGISRSSWDALLKVLEEPPPGLLWIFCTTAKHKIPLTIQSRLVSLDLKLVPDQIIATHLANIMPDIQDPIIFETIARAGNNSIRDSLTLLEKVIPYCNEVGWSIDNVNHVLGSLDLNNIQAVLNCIVQHDSGCLWATIDDLINNGVEPDVIFNTLVDVVDRLLALSVGATIELPDVYRASFANLGVPRVIYLSDVILKRTPNYTEMTNKKFVLKLLAVELCG